MKIEHTPTANPYTSKTPAGDTGFETLLMMGMTDKPQNDGDAYYWQHQDQLQQSALTFKTPMHSTKPLMPDAAPHLTIANECHQTLNIPKDAILKRVQTTKPAEINKDILLDNPMDTMFVQFKNSLQRLSITPDKPPLSSETYAKNAIKPMSSTRQQVLSTFKNYQLFISDSQVELSIQTEHLSNQDVRELHIAIKHWLTDNGYSLKKWVINGVQQ